MDGLRNFIESDNYRAVDVTQLRRGARQLKVQKPKFSEDFPEAAIREGPEELTLRAEEVDTVKHVSIASDRWRPHLVDVDWHAFCQAIYSEWRELYKHYKEICRAAGAKKSSESQKARALWA